MGKAWNRPVRVKNVPPGRNLLQLDARSRLCRDGRNEPAMGSSSSLCFSPLLPNRTMPEEGSTRTPHYDHNYACVDITTLVPSVARTGSERSPLAGIGLGHTPESQGRRSSISRQRLHEVGGVANLRERVSAKRISDEALALMCKSRAPGTRLVYQSAWNQYASWCSERQIDPIACPIDDVVNYLYDLFDRNRKYRTINTHRSAISAYHQLVDGAKVGSHPYVTQLLRGVAHENPPLPRHILLQINALLLQINFFFFTPNQRTFTLNQRRSFLA